jgi:preprotein translocase subunit YajC
MILFNQLAHADAPATTAATSVPASPPVIASAQPSALGTALPFVLMAGVFYFLMIRPQQKKAKDHESMVNTLQKGEEVITRGGIIGKIHGVAEKFITLEVDQNVRIKILKNQIETVLRTEQKA